jgi:hypothetical protein
MKKGSRPASRKTRAGSKKVSRGSRGAGKAGKTKRPAKTKRPTRTKRATRTKRSARPASRAARATPAVKKKKGTGRLAGALRAGKKGKKTAPPLRRDRGEADRSLGYPSDPRGVGAESGGQSGDNEDLSRAEEADSESVEELVEEGQAFEAGIIGGVQNAPDADQGGVRTREVPEDDVPQEYLDED